MVWICETCTYGDNDVESDVCEVCETQRKRPVDGGMEEKKEADHWVCEVCTMLHEDMARIQCEMCRTERPGMNPAPSAEQQQQQQVHSPGTFITPTLEDLIQDMLPLYPSVRTHLYQCLEAATSNGNNNSATAEPTIKVMMDVSITDDEPPPLERVPGVSADVADEAVDVAPPSSAYLVDQLHELVRGPVKLLSEFLRNAPTRLFPEADAVLLQRTLLKRCVEKACAQETNMLRIKAMCCALCKRSGYETSIQFGDNCGEMEHPVCLSCSRQHVMTWTAKTKEAVARYTTDDTAMDDSIDSDDLERELDTKVPCPYPDCKQVVGMTFLKACLSRTEMESYYDLCTEISTVVGQAKGEFMRCPNNKCRRVLEVIGSTASQPDIELPPEFVITETDDQGKVLSRDAYQHFRQHRIRCHGCQTNFCAQCRKHPYHKGRTCDEEQHYQNSIVCRYCDEPFVPVTGEESHPSDAVVCSAEGCQEKKKRGCFDKLPCGHLCYGVCEDAQSAAGHPPCLHPDCGDELGDEFCAVCYVGALKCEPVVKLDSCSHLFHESCVLAKIQKRWAGVRITFGFLTCASCKVPMDHAGSKMLRDALEPINKLQREIGAKAMARLKIEDMENDDRLLKPDSRYYQQPLQYALDSFAFYSCFKCKNFYFGGRRGCEDNAAADNRPPEEFICYACGTFCLAADTLVTLQGGIARKIQDIEVGDTVMSVHGKELLPTPVTKKMVQGVRRCLKLTFLDGRTLLCTPDHRILTPNGWVEAKDLRPQQSSVIFGPGGRILPQQSEFTDWSIDSTAQLGYRLDMSPGSQTRTLACFRILGYLLTDGTVGLKDRGSLFLGHEIDVAAAKKDLELFTDTDLKWGMLNNTYVITVPVKLLRLYTQQFGVQIGARGKSICHLPQVLTDPACPLGVVKAFLSGTFGGDGRTLSLKHYKGMTHLSAGLGWSVSCKGDIAAQQMAILQSELGGLLERAGISRTYMTWSTWKRHHACPLTEAGRQRIEQLKMLGASLGERPDLSITTEQDSINLLLHLSVPAVLPFHEEIGFSYCCHKQTRLEAGAAIFKVQRFALSQRRAIADEFLRTEPQKRQGGVTWRQRFAIAKQTVASQMTLHESVSAWVPSARRHVRTSSLLKGFSRSGFGGLNARRLLTMIHAEQCFSAPKKAPRYSAIQRPLPGLSETFSSTEYEQDATTAVDNQPPEVKGKRRGRPPRSSQEGGLIGIISTQPEASNEVHHAKDEIRWAVPRGSKGVPVFHMPLLRVEDAGLQETFDIAVAMNPDDANFLANGICVHNCSDMAKKCNDKAHVENWLWKCRFCCAPSVWSCFGTTHFCMACHTSPMLGIVQRRTKAETPQCAGPGKCPSGGNHGPNGNSADCEWVFGCGLCGDKLHRIESESKKEAQQNEAADQIMQQR